MVNASKILTVSYGTFSCTLEGFDDPFNTMRSIAEYFRDLASEDRYFGAEPPTPDAEMLHRIAEREIQKRVESKVEDNGVVLRQVEDQSEEVADTSPNVEAEAETEADNAPIVVPAEAVGTIVGDIPENETVAQKLARIRAAVARSRNEAEPLMNTVFSEDEHAEGQVQAPAAEVAFDAADVEDAPQVGEVVADDDASDVETSDENDEISAFDDEGAASDIAEDQQPEEDALAEDTFEEDTAEEEAFEDDVVETEAEAEEPVLDVEIDEPVIDVEDDAPVVEVFGGEAAVTEEQIEAVSEEDADDDFDLSGMEMDVETASGEETSAETDVETDTLAAMLSDSDDTAPEPDLTAEDEAPIDLSSVIGDMADDPDEAPVAEDAETEEEVGEFVDEPLDLSPFLDSEEEGDSAEADEKSELKVRVAKVSRAEFEEQFEEIEEDAEAGAADDMPHATGEAEIRETLGETGLSAEDEDDLVKELAEVERDAAGVLGEPDASDEMDAEDGIDFSAIADELTDTPETDAQEAPEVSESEQHIASDLEDLVAEASGDAQEEAPQRRASDVDADDASVERLLARTDSAMEDNDGTRRRSAIATLKAAVAAVRADGDSAKAEEEAQTARAMDMYRDDLAHVVRDTREDEDEAPTPTPVKPEVSESSTTRPRTERKMPPLMLVSEQRVDKDENAEPATPVMPRRVMSTDIDFDAENELFVNDGATGEDSAAGNMFGSGEDFQGYIAETGAEGVTEFIEASLAFGMFVEGANFNTRPQIMHRMLGMFPDGSVTREDGLRAFGILLREGRIHRIQRGQFLLAEKSRFHPQNSDEPRANTA